ncbi:MAG: HINT domain-containing protein [Lachnospiraceae bacterium]|nr:HINT domain-containing protein [Lachnospiraceae bacterium]
MCAIPGIGDAVGVVRNGTRIAKTLKNVGNVIRSAQKLYVTAASASKALFAKAAEIRFNTTSKETADAVCGKNLRYSGVGCFVAGTIVATRDGEKNIEDIREGDYVLAENPETGEQEYKRVVQTFIHEKYLLVHVYAEDEEIITTEEHPFYVEGTGFVSAGELQCGDILRLADGREIPVKQKGFKYLEEPVLVYNFEVEDFHTYYVSGLGVLVHNDCLLEGGSNSIKLRDTRNISYS